MQGFSPIQTGEGRACSHPVVMAGSDPQFTSLRSASGDNRFRWSYCSRRATFTWRKVIRPSSPSPTSTPPSPNSLARASIFRNSVQQGAFVELVLDTTSAAVWKVKVPLVCDHCAPRPTGCGHEVDRQSRCHWPHAAAFPRTLASQAHERAAVAVTARSHRLTAAASPACRLLWLHHELVCAAKRTRGDRRAACID